MGEDNTKETVAETTPETTEPAPKVESENINGDDAQEAPAK